MFPVKACSVLYTQPCQRFPFQKHLVCVPNFGKNSSYCQYLFVLPMFAGHWVAKTVTKLW
jgi:hypothetical protein